MRKQEITDQVFEETVKIFKDTTPIFAVLNDENRQRILVEIARADYINVNDLTDKINLSRPAVSHHLKTLKLAGLIDVKKRGTESLYFLTLKDTVQQIEVLLAAIKKACYLE